MRPFLIVLAVLCLFAPARADLVLPGTKRVSHQLVIAPSEVWTGQRIVALPVRGFGSHAEVERGVPFDFSTKYGTRLYVLAAAEEVPRVVDQAWREKHVSADIPVREISSVPLTSPLESALTTLRITALDGERFELVLVDTDERYDGWALAALAGAFVLGVTALMYLRRRRKHAARAS